MTKLVHLNKFIRITISLFLLFFYSTNVIAAVDIWEKKEVTVEQNKDNKKTPIQSPIISENQNKIIIQIDEQEINTTGQSIIGIFDPEENNFKLDMWAQTDGEDIKKILNRINKLKLSKLAENLLFQVLFTNTYPPKKNLSSKEFLKIKINWLIKNRRFKDLEVLLKNNPEVGNHPKAVKFLINEYLSSTDIKSACERVNFIGQDIQNDYLDKFLIYCLVNNDRKDEAQLLFDLARERGFKDKFFENKINFLMGITEKTNQDIADNNLLNFYLSHITNKNFEYEPTEKTNKYIWRYLSAANLIKIKNIEDEEVISTYEKAAASNSFNKDEVFNIYKQILFNVNQLINSKEVYKTLPNYKARALIYQSILLSQNIEKKLDLVFLLKDLFIKDKLFNLYSEELINILKEIDSDKIPEDYSELVVQSLEKDFEIVKKIKFDNDILHRSKVIKHFLDNNEKISRTEKDFKVVYKKIKRNKKYFISIKDIIVLESLLADGVSLPKELNYSNLSSQLSVPKNLQELVTQKQTGLVMLKIVEIIGEDDIYDLDPETIYFLCRILNDLNLKKIRNDILRGALPVRV